MCCNECSHALLPLALLSPTPTACQTAIPATGSDNIFVSVPGKLKPSDEPARLAMNSSTPPDHMPGLHCEALCWSAVSAAANNQSSGCALWTHANSVVPPCLEQGITLTTTAAPCFRRPRPTALSLWKARQWLRRSQGSLTLLPRSCRTLRSFAHLCSSSFGLFRKTHELRPLPLSPPADDEAWLPAENGCTEVRDLMQEAPDQILHLALLTFADPAAATLAVSLQDNAIVRARCMQIARQTGALHVAGQEREGPATKDGVEWLGFFTRLYLYRMPRARTRRA